MTFVTGSHGVCDNLALPAAGKDKCSFGSRPTVDSTKTRKTGGFVTKNLHQHIQTPTVANAAVTSSVTCPRMFQTTPGGLSVKSSWSGLGSFPLDELAELLKF